MASRIDRRLALALLVILAHGCGSSPPARYYTLDATARAEGSPGASYAVAVGPVSIPAAVDRPQFVVLVAPNRVELAEFERWAGPLDDGIARVVAGNLALLLGTPRVATGPLHDLDATYSVTIDVQRFDSIPGEAVVVEAFWAVRNLARDETRSGRTSSRQAVQGDGFDALAAAHSRALGELSSEIAAAIRDDAARP